MIWAEKTVRAGDAATVQEQFENLFILLGWPDDMMFVSSDAKWPDEERLIISLPDERLLALFDGFEAMPEVALPKTARLLVAKQAAFEERFGFPR
jgi:hypothetical protein